MQTTYTVETRILESESFFTGAKSTEILTRFRDNILAKLHNNATSGLSADSHIKINFRVRPVYAKERMKDGSVRKRKWR